MLAISPKRGWIVFWMVVFVLTITGYNKIPVGRCYPAGDFPQFTGYVTTVCL